MATSGRSKLVAQRFPIAMDMVANEKYCRQCNVPTGGPLVAPDAVAGARRTARLRVSAG